METLKICPVCSGSSFNAFIDCIDYTVSKETFSIVLCTQCNLKFTNPRPAENEVSKYYESDDYISHSNTNKGIINKIYHFVKKRSIRNKLKLLDSLKTKKSLLDIGCGTGSF